MSSDTLQQTIKQTLKRGYYAVRPARLPADLDLSLGYVLHTERCYDTKTFEQLLRFCRDYVALTGHRPICTVMTGVNPRIERGCARQGLSPAGYADRIRELAEVACLGYHGHFWLDPAPLRARIEQRGRHGSKELEMRCNNFLEAPLREQLTADLEWFASHGLDHHGAYAGGWWFTNRALLGILLEHGFRFDFTFSHTLWFRNEYSYMLLESKRIPPGVPFVVHRGADELLCVQMLIGCHQTPLVDDFRRNLASLIGPQRAVFGVVGAHDYDLDPENTLRALRALHDEDRVEFFDLAELQARQGLGRPLRFDLEQC